MYFVGVYEYVLDGGVVEIVVVVDYWFEVVLGEGFDGVCCIV